LNKKRFFSWLSDFLARKGHPRPNTPMHLLRHILRIRICINGGVLAEWPEMVATSSGSQLLSPYPNFRRTSCLQFFTAFPFARIRISVFSISQIFVFEFFLSRLLAREHCPATHALFGHNLLIPMKIFSDMSKQKSGSMRLTF
jgi:hypothetical protein